MFATLGVNHSLTISRRYGGSDQQGEFVMSDELEQHIRARAYEIWMRNGQVDGRADEHWLEAERQVREGLVSSRSAVAACAAPARKSKSPSAAKRAQPARSSRGKAAVQ
jgi:hypothetical protein